MKNYTLILISLFVLAVTASGAMALNITANDSSYIDYVPSELNYTIQTYDSAYVNFSNQVQNITVPDSDQLSLNASIDTSIQLWINFPSYVLTANSTNAILAKGITSGNLEYLIFLTNNTGVIRAQVYNSTGGTSCDANYGPAKGVPNQWTQVVFNHNSSWCEMYINGSFIAHTAPNLSIETFNSDQNLTLGSLYGSTRGQFNGSIDDVKIWHTPLNAKDIKILYNSSQYGLNLGQPFYILNYHAIVRDGQTTSDETIQESNFSEQMSFLKNNGIKTITYIDLENHMRYNTTLPEKSVIINFDDWGYSEYQVAMPILNNYSFKAVFALTTNNTNATEWRWLKELQDKYGWQIVPHGDNHSNSISLNYSQRQRFFTNSRQDIAGNLSNSFYPNTFVYPWASSNSSIDIECNQYYYICIHNYSNPTSFKVNFANNINGLNITRIAMTNATTIDTFRTIFNVWNNISLNLQMNEGAGSIIYDSSKYNNNATLYANRSNNGVIKQSVEPYYEIRNSSNIILLPSILKYNYLISSVRNTLPDSLKLHNANYNLTYTLYATSLANALIYNGTSLCNSTSNSILGNTGSVNITLRNNEQCIIVNNFGNVTESVSRQYSPIYMASNANTRTVQSNLTDSVSTTLVMTVTSCGDKTINGNLMQICSPSSCPEFSCLDATTATFTDMIYSGDTVYTLTYSSGKSTAAMEGINAVLIMLGFFGIIAILVTIGLLINAASGNGLKSIEIYNWGDTLIFLGIAAVILLILIVAVANVGFG